MKAIDTNVLVYSEVVTSAFHEPARALITRLAEGGEPWAIPWPCVYEFLRVVTHPRVYRPPMPLELARRDLGAILGSPSVVLLGPTDRHRAVLDALLDASGVTGNLLFDAQIAALCIEHGVSELLSGDRDFAIFRSLRWTNPFARP